MSSTNIKSMTGVIALETANSKPRESPADRVRIVCDLYNMAFEMKSLELERRYPSASPEWIKQETLRLMELGTR